MTRTRLAILYLSALFWLTAGFRPAAAQILFRPVLGGLPADSGLAAGFELLRHRTLGPFDARTRFVGSVKQYEHVDLGLESPPPATHDFFSEIRLRYRNYPEEDFWGLGPDSDESARSNYRLEDVRLRGMAGLHFRSGFRVAGVLGFTKANVGPGRDDDFPSTGAAFRPEEAPGLTASPDYWQVGLQLDYDRRDDRDDPRAGQFAAFEWTRFGDRAPGDFSFDRFELDYRHFFALSNSGRLAGRVRILLAEPRPGHTIPFYLQPSVGGTDTVRGFDQYRFRSDNALVFNLEYRQAWKGVFDIVLFADAGRVTSRRSELGLADLHGSAGVGGRVRFGSQVFFGADLGFSREGHEIWFRSDHTF